MRNIELSPLQLPAGNRMGASSDELRARSRVHGRLYEPAHAEIDCPGCGEMFRPALSAHTHCKACRKEARDA